MVKRKTSKTEWVANLVASGFDQSYPTSDGVRPKCSQCEAAAINGIACHETGCPNQTHECAGCDAILTNRHQKYCEDCQ